MDIVCSKSPSSNRRAARGFTLVELLVVILIVALLIALLLPGLAAARASGKNAGCLSNLHQVSVALSVYRADHRGAWPPAWNALVDNAANPDLPLICPADPDRGPFSYMLLTASPGPAWAAICDTLNPSKVLIATDKSPWHGWSNGSWLDGHAGRTQTAGLASTAWMPPNHRPLPDGDDRPVIDTACHDAPER